MGQQSKIAERVVQDGDIVTFEGIDRAGKTTIVENLSSELNNMRKEHTVCNELESPIGDHIRKVLSEEIPAEQKVSLFAADRAWTYINRCQPALADGKLVLWDRYVDSAFAYRGAEISLDATDIDISLVQNMNSMFRDPNLILYIDIKTKTSIRRGNQHEAAKFYDREYLSEVQKQYQRLRKRRDYVVIDGERSIDEITAEILTILDSRGIITAP
jgi:dTMP kinase